jgi:hypothetical protein
VYNEEFQVTGATLQIIEKLGEEFFASEADLIVVPVNLRGHAGAGLSRLASKRFPGWFESYRRAVHSGNLRFGVVHATAARDRWSANRWRSIVSAPVRETWCSGASLGDVRLTLEALRMFVGERAGAVALPALGCERVQRVTGLSFDHVRAATFEIFENLPGIIELYRPADYSFAGIIENTNVLAC